MVLEMVGFIQIIVNSKPILCDSPTGIIPPLHSHILKADDEACWLISTGLHLRCLFLDLSVSINTGFPGLFELHGTFSHSLNSKNY